jgi:hypothetical protein
MDAQPLVDTLSHPALRRAAVSLHGLTTAWFLLNGVAHQGHVLYKAHAGTLRSSPQGLLWVGLGLLLVGAALTLTLAPLWRPQGALVLPALAGLGLAALVLAAIAARYGFTFLTGSIALTALDALLLVALVTWRPRS